MAVVVISKASGVTAEQDKAMIEALNLESDPPKGARARLAGPSEGGWQIISLWDSQESWDAFVSERLTPALDRAGRSMPDYEVWPVESELFI
jgi:hypothetical protein